MLESKVETDERWKIRKVRTSLQQLIVINLRLRHFGVIVKYSREKFSDGFHKSIKALNFVLRHLIITSSTVYQ